MVKKRKASSRGMQHLYLAVDKDKQNHVYQICQGIDCGLRVNSKHARRHEKCHHGGQVQKYKVEIRNVLTNDL